MRARCGHGSPKGQAGPRAFVVPFTPRIRGLEPARGARMYSRRARPRGGHRTTPDMATLRDGNRPYRSPRRLHGARRGPETRDILPSRSTCGRSGTSTACAAVRDAAAGRPPEESVSARAGGSECGCRRNCSNGKTSAPVETPPRARPRDGPATGGGSGHRGLSHSLDRERGIFRNCSTTLTRSDRRRQDVTWRYPSRGLRQAMGVGAAHRRRRNARPATFTDPLHVARPRSRGRGRGLPATCSRTPVPTRGWTLPATPLRGCPVRRICGRRRRLLFDRRPAAARTFTSSQVRRRDALTGGRHTRAGSNTAHPPGPSASACRSVRNATPLRHCG